MLVNEQKPRGARLQIAVIALVFFGPLLLATWMYQTGRLMPAGTSNHGDLLDPVVSISDVLPSSPLLTIAGGQWVMLYANESVCGEGCRDALYRMRQTRLMLGKEMDRVERVFLHGESSPDTVFLRGEHPGLETINDPALTSLLEEKRPKERMPGGIWLIDPLANLVMYFPPLLDPRDMVDDMKHLLKLSRIG